MNLTINVVIPMAGQGMRFKNRGYSDPKPFIKLNNKTLIEIVLSNLTSHMFNEKIFLIAQEEHCSNYPAVCELLESKFKAKIIKINDSTRGSLDTISYATKYLEYDYPLLIANSDQFVEFHIDDFLKNALDRNLDGSILVFDDPELNPKWSFVKTDEKGRVIEVAEKIVISKYASVGIYFFKSTFEFLSNLRYMLENTKPINGEFYTCPIYNLLISQNKNVGMFEISSIKMNGLGTPEDLEKFDLNKLTL